MVDKITVDTVCDHCSEELEIQIPVNDDFISSLELKPGDYGNIGFDNIAPDIRASWLNPKEGILVYKVSTKDLAKFLEMKVKMVDPNIKLVVTSTFISRGKQFSNKANHAYSSLQLTFSTNAIKKNDYGEGWPYEYGNDRSKVILLDSLANGIIKRYSYNRQQLIELTKPKRFDVRYKLEQKLSIDDDYLKDLIRFSVPNLVKNKVTGEYVVVVVISPELVLKDMFKTKDDKSVGLLNIKSVNIINEGLIEYDIHLYPGKSELKENPHVRQIMLGEGKIK